MKILKLIAYLTVFVVVLIPPQTQVQGQVYCNETLTPYCGAEYIIWDMTWYSPYCGLTETCYEVAFKLPQGVHVCRGCIEADWSSCIDSCT